MQRGTGLFAVEVHEHAHRHRHAMGDRQFARAQQGKTYEAWVIPAGGDARPAGLFAGGGTSVVHLRGTVPSGAVVAATVERAGGTTAPTTAPVVTAHIS